MKKAFVLVLMLIIFSVKIQAQVVYHATDTFENTQRNTVIKHKTVKPIKHEMSIGARLNTDGWSVYTDIGKVKPIDYKHSDMFYNVRFFQFEFSEKKSPEEEKTSSDYSNSMGGSNTYVYGKINNFYSFKIGYGFRSMFAGKPDPGTLSIHWVNTGGISIGLLKPYYLDLYTDPQAVKYTPATASDFLNQDLIEGSAGFSTGLGELQIIPGIYYRSAVHFDFSANRKTALAIETGIDLEYYSQQIAIMANQSPTAFFADLFVSFQFGKRW